MITQVDTPTIDAERKKTDKFYDQVQSEIDNA